MSTQHTPGPWSFHLVKVQRDIYTEQGGAPVAYTRGAGYGPNSDEQDAANARLIAAAPNLLEALRDMVSDHADLSEKTLQFARAAIAKATGGAP